MQKGQVERGAISTRLLVVVALIVVMVIGGLVYKQYRAHIANSPETAGATFMAAITQKDGGTSYAMFTDDAKKKMSNDDWNAWVVFAFDKYSGGTPPLIKKESVPDPAHFYSKDHDTVTRLRYQLPYDGKTYTYDVIMVQTSSGWKVGSVGGLQ
jgi:hypothetical protein